MLIKNAHLRRSPHPSPYQARGRLVAAYIQVRLTPQDCLPERQVKGSREPPVNGISKAQLASACLRVVPPLRDEGRGIFYQPQEISFSIGSLDLAQRWRGAPTTKGTGRCRSGAILIKFRSSGHWVEGLTLAGASFIKFKPG